MARVQKFTSHAVPNQLRHNDRQIKHSSNKDIDPTLSCQNYSLTPDRDGLTPYEYFKIRCSELYIYNREDVKVMAGWVVTAPKEIASKEQQKEFFQSTYDFLEQRYGRENVIQAVVHRDEGKREPVNDRWGNPVLTADGQQKTQLVCGQPHLHFCFIPVVEDGNAKHMQQEKICANDVLNRHELRTFHSDLQEYLDSHGVEGKVATGAVKDFGRNRSVKELKQEYEIQKEMDRLREIERKYEMEHNRDRSGRWQ